MKDKNAFYKLIPCSSILLISNKLASSMLQKKKKKKKKKKNGEAKYRSLYSCARFGIIVCLHSAFESPQSICVKTAGFGWSLFTPFMDACSIRTVSVQIWNASRVALWSENIEDASSNGCILSCQSITIASEANLLVPYIMRNYLLKLVAIVD